MRPAGGIADAEDFHVVPQFAEGRRCGSAAQARTHDDDVEFTLVVGAYQMDFGFPFGPFAFQGTCGNFSIQFLCHIHSFSLQF